MRYESFEGKVEDLIRMKLCEIEKKENVKVLYAVESGSRAWGFASPDSDYDVRFIYVRSKEAYVSLQNTDDYIDWELNEILDINGWDLKKVLKHFYKSNATLFEWSNSPIVYYTTNEWEEIYEIAKEYFAYKPILYHYYGTANKNYHEYLLEDMVSYKKYFYVLRPVLACKWVEKKKCPPPVLFSELIDNVLEDELKPIVKDLLEKKVTMLESDKAPRIDKLNKYIEENLKYYKIFINDIFEDRKIKWDDLNELFAKIIFRY